MSLAALSYWWVAYFVVGLLLLVSVSYRQFNEPSWLVDNENKIRTLPPSDLVEARRFRRARALYVAVVIIAFVLLCTVQPLMTVILTTLSVAAGSGIAAAEGGGDLPVLGAAIQEAGEAVREANPNAGAVTMAAKVESMYARPEFPIILALAMITAMRLPLAQRLESWLRWFAQDRFGIPTLPETLYNRLDQIIVPVKVLDADLDAEPGAEPIGARAAGFAQAAFDVLGPVVSRTALAEQLVKIFAYRAWVRDFKVWPSPEVFPNASALARWNARLLDEIVALQQDLTLLSGDDFPWDTAGIDEDRAQAMKRLRIDRWKRCITEIERLSGEVCALIVLIDQRSHRPNPNRPTAAALDRLLAELHEEDQDNSPMCGRLLSLAALAPVVCFGAGALLALGWRRIAVTLADPPLNPDAPGFSWAIYGPNFDIIQAGTLFAISGMTVYGVAVLVGGLWIGGGGRDGERRGRPKTPVAFRALGIFVACFVAVLLAYSIQVVLMTAEREGWDAVGLSRWLDAEGVTRREIGAALGQAMLGGLFGTMVATLSFVRVRRRSMIARIALSAVFIVLMALLGRLIGLYAIPASQVETQILHGQIYAGVALAMALLAALLLLPPHRRPFAPRSESHSESAPAPVGLDAVGAHAT